VAIEATNKAASDHDDQMVRLQWYPVRVLFVAFSMGDDSLVAISILLGNKSVQALRVAFNWLASVNASTLAYLKSCWNRISFDPTKARLGIGSFRRHLSLYILALLPSYLTAICHEALCATRATIVGL
jgi:hypothetical protein